MGEAVSKQLSCAPGSKRLQKNQVLAKLLHVFAALYFLMIGADFSAIEGRRASTLGLPFAWLVISAPLLVLSCYVILGLSLRRVLPKFRWVLALFVSPPLVLLPLLHYVTVSTQSIALSRWLEPKEKSELEKIFKHPYVHYSATSQGIRLVVRRSEFDPSLLRFLESINAVQKP